MNAYHRYKNRLEQFLQTERGKRFINFAYSFGAAIVILGAMFKLLHFPFGNEMLFIGMVTECIVFVLSAFDTPVRDYRWEQVFPTLSSATSADPSNAVSPSDASALQAGMAQPERGQTAENRSDKYTQENTDTAAQNRSGTVEPDDTVQSRSGEPPAPYDAIPSHFPAQAEEYGQQMENLNRTLSGLNAIYEIQLKSVGGQIGSIEQINRGLTRLSHLYGDTLPDGAVIKAETEKMAEQLRELNEVYARMLSAMTVNRNDNPGNSDNPGNPRL